MVSMTLPLGTAAVFDFLRAFLTEFLTALSSFLVALALLSSFLLALALSSLKVSAWLGAVYSSFEAEADADAWFMFAIWALLRCSLMSCSSI